MLASIASCCNGIRLSRAAPSVTFGRRQSLSRPSSVTFGRRQTLPRPSSVPAADNHLPPAPLLYGCALGWAALTPPCLLNARPVVQGFFGLPTGTFEDNLREPAAGLLEITSPLFPLEASLLVALASSVAVAEEDRSRIGAALFLTSLGTLTTFATNAAGGLSVAAGPADLAGLIGLMVASGAIGLSAAKSSPEPLALYRSDAAELLSFGAPSSSPAGGGSPTSMGGRRSFDQVSLFYRSSALVGLLVGASFLFSPISPISIFEAEGPVTHMMREDLGVYIVGLLCPIQAALFRAARDGKLGDASTRLLNAVTGLACAVLVLDGKAQVELGSASFASLTPDDPFYPVVQQLLGDPAAVGRSVTNTNAAFTVGFVVAAVYLFNGAFASKGKSE
jgi:hypothetical protein